MTRTAGTLVAAAVFASCVSAQESEARNAAVAFDGATSVEIRARAGSLKVIGQPGLAAVTVNGTARASRRGMLSDIRLVAERRGDVIHIEAVLPQASSRRFFGFGNNWSALDLEIHLPAGTPVVASDGSGAAEFRRTGELRVRDGSGSLLIEEILGGLDVEDGSGELVVRNIAGPVRIRDGSGSMRIEGVGHDLTVRDGSGSISIRRVGNVTITADGSGDLEIVDATGSVRIESKRSGRVLVRDVAGDLTVVSGRARRVRHENVRGRVTLPAR